MQRHANLHQCKDRSSGSSEDLETESYFTPMVEAADYNRFSYCFATNSKTLIEIDNSQMIDRRITIDTLPECLGLLAGICYLEDCSVLYCGGTPNNGASSAIRSVYKIKPRTQEWQKLPDLPCSIFRFIPLRIKTDIYIFGGRNARCEDLSTVWKYNIESGHSQALPPMPRSSFNVSCVSVGTSILLFGKSTAGILEFNGSEYKTIMPLGGNYGVLLKNHIGELFLLFQGKIYSSHETCYSEWNIVGEYSQRILDHSIEAAPQQFGDYICFKIWHMKYIRFNFKDLTLELASKHV